MSGCVTLGSDDASPVGIRGAQQAGVFWLLEEEILHKERRDFVRWQNRGVHKICQGTQKTETVEKQDRSTASVN